MDTLHASLSDPDFLFPMTDEMVAFMAAADERRREITSNRPIEVRREYMPQDMKVTPLYLATRLHIAELWLEAQRGR